MTLYHSAAFTVDTPPFDDVVMPAVGMDGTGRADEFQQASDAWREAQAGPLSMEFEDVGLTLTATVSGIGGARSVTFDWGDGESVEKADLPDNLVDVTGSHAYSGTVQVNVTATAEI